MSLMYAENKWSNKSAFNNRLKLGGVIWTIENAENYCRYINMCKTQLKIFKLKLIIFFYSVKINVLSVNDWCYYCCS